MEQKFDTNLKLGTILYLTEINQYFLISDVHSLDYEKYPNTYLRFRGYLGSDQATESILNYSTIKNINGVNTKLYFRLHNDNLLDLHWLNNKNKLEKDYTVVGELTPIEMVAFDTQINYARWYEQYISADEDGTRYGKVYKNNDSYYRWFVPMAKHYDGSYTGFYIIFNGTTEHKAARVSKSQFDEFDKLEVGVLPYDEFIHLKTYFYAGLNPVIHNLDRLMQNRYRDEEAK